MKLDWTVSLGNRALVLGWLRRRYDAQTAEEALERALAEVEQRLDSYQSEQHFVNAWKQRAARRAIDVLRRRCRRPRLRGPGPSPAWRSRVRAILDELTEIPRNVIVWYHLEGEVDQEIGQRLWPGLSRAAQTSRAFRLRRQSEAQLRQRFEKAGLDTLTFDFDLGPFGQLRRELPGSR